MSAPSCWCRVRIKHFSASGQELQAEILTCPLHEAAEDLLALAKRFHPLNSLSLYEDMAAAFYRETGEMAPGKDRPAAFGGPETEQEREARRRKWSAWRDAWIERQYDSVISRAEGR